MSYQPHCKHDDHVRVSTTIAEAGTSGPGDVVALLVAQLHCENDAGAVSWGVNLKPTRTKSRGMFLFPDAARFLQRQLAAVVSQSPDNAVVIQHTVNGSFRVWRTFTSPAAGELAAQLATIIGGQ